VNDFVRLDDTVALTTVRDASLPPSIARIAAWVETFFATHASTTLDELRLALNASGLFTSMALPVRLRALRELAAFGMLAVIGRVARLAARYTCPRCGRDLELTEENFYRHGGAPSGFQGICRLCDKNRRDRTYRSKVRAEGHTRSHEVSQRVARKIANEATPLRLVDDYHAKYRGVVGPIIFGCVSPPRVAKAGARRVA
jgi:hypothetical protein